MVDAINAWLKIGQNYLEGVSLYEQYGSSSFLKKTFKKAETAFNRQKLNSELVAIRDAAPASPKSSPKERTLIAPASPAAAAPSPAPAHIAPANHPPEKKQLPALLEVISLRQQTYNEIRALAPLLHSEPEGENLRAIAERIVRLGKKNAELWERYNFLSEHSGEPEQTAAPLPPVMIDLNLLAKREQIRKNLNKAEHRLKGQSKPKQKTIDLIATLGQQLRELDEKIALIKKGAQE